MMVGKKLRIAYILSLPHSGSTILAHHLSAHRPVVNLGEAAYGIQRLADRGAARCPCACGNIVRECEFWSGFENADPARPNFGDPFHYRRLVHRFREVYGNEGILLDANKTSEPIRFYCDMTDCDVYAIHLVRDFRGACVSEAARKKKNHPDRPEWFTATQAAFQWMRRNRSISRLLDSLPLAGRKCLSYEALCKNPETILSKVTDWLGASPDPCAPCDHALIGNKLGFSAGHRGILYDDRWRKSRAYYPALLLFPILPLLNRRWVYS